MRHDESHSRPPRQGPGFEMRDVALDVLIKWGIALFVFVGLSSAAAWVAYKVFAPEDPKAARLASLPFSEKRPPEPRLQSDPKIDIQKFREEEDKALHSYGWVDKNAGIVKIPIERAMTLLEQRGLPTPPANTHFQAKPAPAPAAGSEGSARRPIPQETPPTAPEGAGIPGAAGSPPQGSQQGAPTVPPTTVPVPPPGR
ncbi:MAG TPA: hypothetical protein VFB21_02405 [Chthonomonadaceae bacterium]|nr:hypothetical protein [Chthonomonadaceae bacterium]